ncbi:unnamed protein product [Rotaria magnacalcarata]|uniref:Uncharacterized protein n=1 Tax=Rotaria magnacalcarata TaxID=392030 RepID=A0A819G8R6_9BILA|nr:unnamed protein product [Rotaria magnacalcarata]CAF1683376.1 unnamed protein product [Rotaria magnacalcarata]CAF2140858.1 unnamed protein product [Rotaria magnacalcarata]CAF2153364.1 unnamed protein product [Rotaria magnacalcarata]CAF2267154.1 unnamed protein product [Rotaria magnacalcarata]
MGNDKNFVPTEDLPFRLIETPIGSAPFEDFQTVQCHRYNKSNNQSISQSRFEGYDAPPSLLPPPILPKRYDEPILNIPQRSDREQLNSKKTSINTKNHRRKVHRKQVTCCVLS